MTRNTASDTTWTTCIVIVITVMHNSFVTLRRVLAKFILFCSLEYTYGFLLFFICRFIMYTRICALFQIHSNDVMSQILDVMSHIVDKET